MVLVNPNPRLLRREDIRPVGILLSGRRCLIGQPSSMVDASMVDAKYSTLKNACLRCLHSLCRRCLYGVH